MTDELSRLLNANYGVDEEMKFRPADDIMFCVIGSQAGRYVPQRFAEEYAINDDDRDILLAGPDGTDHDDLSRRDILRIAGVDVDTYVPMGDHFPMIYWETWDDVLQSFTVEVDDHEHYFTEISGNVFAVRSDISEAEIALYLEW